MKRIFLLFALLLMVSQSNASINIPRPTKGLFANDFAKVINSKDEEEISNILQELYEKSGNSIQVVVVTIDSLGDYSIDEYANQLFNEWGIGNEEKDDGVLILLSVKDRESRIEVGYGLEGCLTDSGTGRIQDEYMLPYYKNGDFSGGLVSGVKAIVDEINKEIEFSNYIKPKNDFVFEHIITFILIFVIFMVVILYFWNKKKHKKAHF